MPETAITNRYYPTLSTVITLDELPEELGFLKEGISNLLDDIHYKDLQYSKSTYGDQAQYSLRIVSRERLELEILGTGIFLVLNPDVADTNISSFPVSVAYKWPILGYIRSFDLKSFAFTPEGFYQLALQILQTSEEAVIGHAINLFVVPEDDRTPLEQLLEDLSLVIPDLGTDPSKTIIEAIESQLNVKPEVAILTQYILSEDLKETKEKLNSFFRAMLPTTDLESYLKELVIPKYSATLELSAGIEFPRKLLQPVDEQTLEVIPVADEDTGQPKAGFKFAEASFYAGDTTGIGYSLDLALSSTTPAMIGNTGLIIEIENLKVDLSESRNIPEADRDGRSADFKGVYAEYAAVTLPEKWFKNNDTADTARISAHDLLIGNGGISGKIALEVLLEEDEKGDTDYYQDYFTLDYPLSAKRTDPTTKKQVVTKLNNHAELIAHYNIDKKIHFVYPISLTDKRNNERRTFTKGSDYNDFLNTIDTTLVPRIGFDMNGFEIGFTSFDMTFHQGKIVESNIVGFLNIPKLKDRNDNPAEIIVTGHYSDDGDFSLTFSEEDGVPFGIPGVADVIVKSLAYVREDNRGYLEVGADVAITNDVIKKVFCDKNQVIPLPNLRFYANPAGFEIVGGSISVPENFSLCLGPVDLSITNIDHGSYQRPLTTEEKNALPPELSELTDRKYKYWGFNGAISVDPLGIDVRGDGVKYYYTDDDDETGLSRDTYIHIKTIAVDLIIPGDASSAEATAIINGYLSIPSPGESPEYSGGVKLEMPQTGIAGSAEMKLAPKYPAFIVDSSIDLPVGIPIASTGLEVTGFRGLLGFRYVAEKEAIGLESGKDTWYDYYTYPEKGVNVPKFSHPGVTGKYKNPVSLGAGATIDTMGPTVISTRVMMLLSIPSLFVIDGRASILSKEWGLDDPGEPPFFAFLAIGDQSIEVGVGADFKLPQDNGRILSMVSNVEAGFFFRDSSAWYVNAGTKDKPNESRALSLVTVMSYLQLSAKGIELGSRGEFIFNRKFGPAKVKAWLFIEIGGKISFERPQIAGYIEAGGGLEVKFWKIKAGVSFNAILSAEAPKPFLIFAKVRVCGKVKLGFVKIRKCISVKVKWEKSKEIDKSPIPPLLPEKAANQVKGVHMLTGEAFDLVELSATDTPESREFDGKVIPLDTYIDIQFTKAVLPDGALKNKIGGFNNPASGFTEMIPPVSTVKGGKSVRQVKHQYRATDINIEAWNGTAWEAYHPYEAVSIKENQTAIPGAEISDLKVGHWQKTRKEYDTIRLLANNPFSYTQQGQPGWTIPEEFGITDSTLFCQGTEREEVSANWLSRPSGQRFHVPFNNPDDYFTQGQLYFQVLGVATLGKGEDNLTEYGEVASEYSNFDFARSLKISNANGVALKFPNPVRKVSLKLSTRGRGVNIRCYQMVIPQDGEDTQVPEFELITGGEIYKAAPELYNEVVFESDEAFSKVVIDPVSANEDRINAIAEQIANLLNDAYETFGEDDEVTVITLDPQSQEIYDQLVAELEEARAMGCSTEIPPARGIGAMEVEDSLIVGVDAFNNGEEPPLLFESPFGQQRTLVEGQDAAESGTFDIGSCYTLLHEVSWLSELDYEYNVNIPGQIAIESDFLASVAATNHIADPIWRPDTHYRIKFTLSDTVDNGSPREFDYYHGFRTAGPLGHYHNATGVTYGGDRDTDGKLLNPSGYPITSLRNYIDYERSYPNANGSLLLAKPLFYGTEPDDDGTGIGNNEVTLFFNRPYLYHMMGDWGEDPNRQRGEMQVIIKDPTENVTFSNPPKTTEELQEIPGGTAEWTADEFPQLQNHVSMIQNMLDALNADADKCTVNLGETIIPKSFKRTIKVTNLKPQKLYTVIVNNIYQGVSAQVHDFGFQTSRYRHFEEQVNSYEHKDEQGTVLSRAIFDIPLSVDDVAINKVYQITSEPGNTGLLSDREIDAFDHVMEGVLNMPPMDPAVTTEFNTLSNAAGETFALLVRNPEPFNDPKIPLEVIRDTADTAAVIVKDATGMVDNIFKILYSKDYSQFLILKKEGTKVVITDQELKFHFRYLRWDGNSYIVKSNVETENISISK